MTRSYPIPPAERRSTDAERYLRSAMRRHAIGTMLKRIVTPDRAFRVVLTAVGAVLLWWINA